MTFVSAEDMSKSLSSSGKVVLYGIYFDTNEDKLRSDSEPLLKEIAKLLSSNPHLSIHVVGHTDNQGKPDSTSISAAVVLRRSSESCNRTTRFPQIDWMHLDADYTLRSLLTILRRGGQRTAGSSL